MDRLKGLGRKFTELKKLAGPTRPLPDLYQYQRLPTDPGTAFIRLFEFLPSKSNSTSDTALLQGRLIQVDLSVNPEPVYDALSYSWGRDILTGRLQDIGSFFSQNKFPRFGVKRLPRLTLLR